MFEIDKSELTVGNIVVFRRKYNSDNSVLCGVATSISDRYIFTNLFESNKGIASPAKKFMSSTGYDFNACYGIRKVCDSLESIVPISYKQISRGDLFLAQKDNLSYIGFVSNMGLDNVTLSNFHPDGLVIPCIRRNSFNIDLKSSNNLKLLVSNKDISFYFSGLRI